MFGLVNVCANCFLDDLVMGVQIKKVISHYKNLNSNETHPLNKHIQYLISP